MNEEEKGYPLTILPENHKKNISKKKLFCVAGSSLMALVIAVMVFSNTLPLIYGSSEEAYTDADDISNGSSVAENLTSNKNSFVKEYETISTQHNDVVDLVKLVSQSVVSINVTLPNRNGILTGADISGSGSGIIFGEDIEKIYIVTNNHVVQGAVNVTISVDDDRKAVAHYVGSNSRSDLAVISVAKNELTNAGIENYAIAVLGDSDRVEVGEYVVAIGNALGEGKTVTDGIISAKNKVINLDSTTLTVLQTNAAINKGNSGGSLVNMEGEVIGINTAKLSTAGVEGMGYSIPINDAKNIFDDIMQNQSLLSYNSNDKPQLGISGITITYDMMNQYDFPSQGVYIVETVPESSAARVGFLSEDIIIGFESARITTIEELAAEFEKCAIGDTVKIYIYRGESSSPQMIRTTIMGAEMENRF